MFTETGKIKNAIQDYLDVKATEVSIADILKEYTIDEKNIPNRDAVTKVLAVAHFQIKEKLTISSLIAHKVGKRVIWKPEKFKSKHF